MGIKPTSEKALEYVWFAQRCLDLKSTGIKAIKDGPTIVICKYDKRDATLIILGGTFLCHPRSGPLRPITYTSEVDNSVLLSVYGAGFGQNGGSGDERRIYPLVDNDQYTFSIDSELLSSEWDSDEAYGNMWWIGEDGTTLSWHSTPNRHFKISSKTRIEGFSLAEGMNSTSFGFYIYQDGVKLCHGPQPIADDENGTLVIGACYFKGTLIAIVVTTIQGVGVSLQVWKSSDTGVKWTQIGGDLPCGKAYTPAFINTAGNIFAYEGNAYKISDSLDAVTKIESIPVTTIGTKVVDGRGGYGSNYSYTGSTINLWPEIDASDKLIYSAVKSSAKFTYSASSTSTNAPTTVTKPIYRGNPATSVSVNTTESGEGIGLHFIATITGGESYCKATWSGVDSSSGLTATADLAPCGGDTVTITLEPQGVVGSYTMPDPAGVITVTGDEQAVFNSGYTATNAVGTVTWSVSSGTIDSNGTITVVGCGTATVTATDSCGRTGTKTIYYAAGYWIYTNPTCTSTACGGGATCVGFWKSDCSSYYLSLGNWIADHTYMGPVYYNTGDTGCLSAPCDNSIGERKANMYTKIWVCP